MATEFSLEELAREVQTWCDRYNVFPANGQAAEELTERTIRYYRTLGLLDAPLGHYTKRFTEKHRLQLIAIRLYQAQGLPLRKIRDELYGKGLADLSALEKQVSKRGKQGLESAIPLFSPMLQGAEECWAVTPLTGEFLLVSRQNRRLPRTIIERLNELLLSVLPNQTATQENNVSN